MSKLAKALTAAAGNAGGGALYAEDVFSTYLYEGNGSTQTITNGIDLDGEGGLVWIKAREPSGGGNRSHVLSDTDRGATKSLFSDTVGAELTYADIITSFNSDGFTSGGSVLTNYASVDFASWTFRKAEKFFDVVTWTGDGTGARTISHSLNGTVGALFMKATNAAMQWFSYHNGLTNAQFLELNATTQAVSSVNAWNNTTPTSSEFTVGSYGNISGRTYVAYLFASDAGGFGDDGDESIIKCGSYTGNGGSQEINLGFEPQWLMVKRTNDVGSWRMFDIMRGMPVGTDNRVLIANGSNAEANGYRLNPTATGFEFKSEGNSELNASGGNYIYIAIRRPMKTPESGTEVFAADLGGSVAPDPWFHSGFPVDMSFTVGPSNPSAFGGWFWSNRFTSGLRLDSSSTAAESSQGNIQYDYMTGAWDTNANTSYFTWMFKRATGFMDVVAYTSTTSAINHNLGVSPELVIYKSRTAGTWYTMVATDGFGELNGSGAWGGAGNGSGLGPNLANATATTITGGGNLYGSGVSMVTYLFASVAGVSKVGSYTGTGATLNVDCGFSAGARFILIKRTDSTGDWYVWDSVRGIVAGNDPYLLLNSTAAEVTSTDYIDPLASGFTVTSSAPAALNASGGTYIFLAIA